MGFLIMRLQALGHSTILVAVLPWCLCLQWTVVLRELLILTGAELVTVLLGEPLVTENLVMGAVLVGLLVTVMLVMGAVLVM